MNSGLPARRISLTGLLRMPEPSYLGRDGREYIFERAELELVKSIMESRGIPDMKLPILLIADAGMEQSTWRVEGEPECAVIMQVLGRDSRDPKDRMFLYPAQLTIVRRKLSTATALMFLP